MKHHRNVRSWVLVAGTALLLGAILVTPLALRPTTAKTLSPSPERTVQRAWQRAQEIGVYSFSSEIVQTVYPAPALINVGRSSRKATIYLEGQANLPESQMSLTLWTGGGLSLIHI